METLAKPPSLPPYPQMIMEAIESQNKREGLNKSTISNFMESTYGDLPAGHSALLSDHLTRMKDARELLLVKNNYLKPDPNAPVQKRGRGRPHKAKDPAEAAAAAESKVPGRGRGRPKKDPNAPPVPKKAKPDPDPDPEPGSERGPIASKSGRPRGRPKKVQHGTSQLAQNGVEAN